MPAILDLPPQVHQQLSSFVSTIPYLNSLPFKLPIVYTLLLFLLLNLIYKPFAAWHRRRMIKVQTAMEDLPTLGRARTEGKKIDGTVVIAGGSISGLMSARVCATHFTRVLIVEPESWTSTPSGLSDDERPKRPISPNGPKPNTRTRVMQYVSLHGYQAFSYLAVKELFPDFDTEARLIDPTSIGPCDYNIHIGGRLLKAPLKAYRGVLPKFVALSRPAYETLLRKLVKKNCENVEFVKGQVVGIDIDVDGPSQGLEGAGTGERIQSVRIRTNEGKEVVEPASLVVDCTGPTCAGIKWLSTKLQNLNTLKKTTYDPKMYYTTCEYQVDPSGMEKVNIPGGWKEARAIYNYLPDSRADSRTFLCMKRENNTLQFAVGGFDLAVKPRSINDVRLFLQSLQGIDPTPEFMYNMLDALEASGADKSASYTDVRCPPCHQVNYYQHRDQLPSNFIAIGDSSMRVNPIRGQGCTKAAVEVATLSGLLDYCNPVFHSNSSREVLPDQFASIFWSRQKTRVGGVWEQTKAEDYDYETTVPVEGETREWGKHVRWYTWNLIAVGRKNPTVANAIYGSAMFLAPGSDVLTPGIMLKVLFAGLKEYLGFTKYGV